MRKLLDLLSSPILDNFAFFLFVFLCIASPAIYSSIYYHWTATAMVNWGAINVILICYVISYIFSLISYLLSYIYKLIYDSVIKVICVLNCLISFCLIKLYGQAINEDIVAIVNGTNVVEIKEYIGTYVTTNDNIIMCTVLLVIILCISCLLNKIKVKKNLFVGCVIVGLLFMSVYVSITRQSYFKEVFPTCLESYFSYDNVDLILSNPEIEYIDEIFPENIVIIIGESFSKSHSSLYGYERETNPRLRGLQKDSLLTVYTNVTSPATHTIACFKSIMSSYKPEYGKKVLWNECVTLPEVLSKAGYKTNWFSNQSKYGLQDNIITKYAELCAINKFSGDTHSGWKKYDLDEEILEIAKPFIIPQGRNAYFFHLIGSHTKFSGRYPSQFSKFKEVDYLNKMENQRKLLSEYDNSILYNDSVVCEIINMFKDKDAVVLYFSDHAIDVFESTNDYIGHAIENNKKSVEFGSAIPFMIYTSPEFIRKYPEKVEMIRLSANSAFRTDDVMYSVMDLIGITIKGETLKGKSLFQLQ